MFEELGICAIKQGYFITIGNKIYLDLIVVLRLREIIKKQLENGKEI